MPKSSLGWLPSEFNSCAEKPDFDAAINHMCADNKATLLPLCEWADDDREARPAAHCGVAWVRELQELLLEEFIEPPNAVKCKHASAG